MFLFFLGYLVTVPIIEFLNLAIVKGVNCEVISGDAVIHTEVSASADRTDIQLVIDCEMTFSAKREHL